jgi:tetratricopeptide (TPR) repeat protein
MKKAVIAALAVVALGVAAAFLLIEGEPATPAEAVARAEKRLDTFSKMTGLTDEETKKEQDVVLEKFRVAGRKWPDSAEAKASATRIAELLRTWRRYQEAFDAFKALGTADGDWTAAEIAESELKQDAMALWEEFATKHRDDPRAAEAAWKVITLKLAAGIDKYAPADIMKACDDFCAAFPKSALRARAMLLKADTLRDVKEKDAALREYDRIIEEFEGNPAAAKALLEKGKILAEQDKPKEAKEALEELERKFPGSDEARQGRGTKEDAERAEAEKAAEEKEKEFFKERYGMPGGDLAGAATPRGTPAQFLGRLLEQRLDIRTYDIDAEVDPAKKSIKASGTATFHNDGEAKVAVYLQIVTGFTLTKAASDGRDLKFQQENTRLLIEVSVPKGADVTLALEWEGAETQPAMPLRLGDEGYAAPGAVWYPTTYVGDVHAGRLNLKAPGTVLTTDTTTPALGHFFAYVKPAAAARGRLTVHGGNARTLDIVEDIVSFYETRFGPLPTAKLALVDVELPDWVGGISPSGLIFLNRAFMAGGKDPTSLLAHELAHQWWGNLVPVTLGRDDYTAWLSEGLASHADALYLEHKFGRERARHHLEKGALVYLERTQKLSDDALLRCWAGHPEYSAVVYLKGAVVAEMLRLELGEAYFAGLRRWAKDCAHRESGLADFRAALEAESKRDLKDWFRQWIESPGFPRLRVSVDGTTLILKQESKAFALALDVEIDGVVKTFTISKSEERFELGAKPAKVVLDPKGKLLKRPGPGNEWTKP